ncbi:PLP-dependent aminotransferase family protein [uncultured Litoreibacter sp.]|uniref:aminotransferase-like domain-containing protein n=1 Tax=uncultured Litoreibacter sp. TaxID=1392394 RepID=UPI002611E4BE|nr:PLP-dependent aminotransferase family protein [uncultured Litoreibacter sp.]
MNTIWFPDLANSTGPKYLALADAIRDAIQSGGLKHGEKLPPVREVAYQLGITAGTVARAYSRLVDAGCLEAVVGRGTFVSDSPSEAVGSGIDISAPLHVGGPIEVDATPHNEGGSVFRVNMISPHLRNVGQSRLLKQLLTEIAKDPPSGMMHYPSRDASKPTREAVAQWLSQAPIGRVSEENVVLTNGGQNAILLIMQAVLRGRKPVVLVEDLAYPGFRRAAELLRAEVIPVATDKNGIIPEALEEAARTHDAQILCTSPEVHNPTCGFTPESRRRQIVDVARKLDFEIMEDDCYRMSLAETPSYRMLAPERSWFVASLSKTLTPSLRIGFAVAPTNRVSVLRRVAEYSFFGLATPLGDLCTKLLLHPETPKIVEAVRQETAKYVRAAVNILGGYDVKWREDVLFLWLALPEGWRANAFCQAAEAEGVQIRSAEDYQGRSAPTLHSVRISINAGVSLSSYEKAIGRLRVLLDNPPEQIMS